VDRVAALIATFPADRQFDLWSGVGLASSFAGGSNRGELEMLRETAAPFRVQLAFGAAVAARGHMDAHHTSPHTELACQVYSGLASEQAVHILDEARKDLPMYDREPAYEIWRKRIQEQFALELGRRK
jgi:hypothetical protein